MQTNLIGARVEVGEWSETDAGDVWHCVGQGMIRAVDSTKRSVFCFIVQWESGKLTFEATYTLRVIDEPEPPATSLERVEQQMDRFAQGIHETWSAEHE